MAFREVGVYEVREVLRLWLSSEGLRAIERLAGMDRKTVRRYVGVAGGLRLVRGGGEKQLADVFMAMVVEAVRPHRTDGHGSAWRLLMASHELIATWVEADLTAVTIHDRLGRRGVNVPLRTVQRYVHQVCGRSRGQGLTVRLADGAPGDECQVDFGRMGLVDDAVSGRRRLAWALIFTAGYSRHCFVWLTFRQTTQAVIAGCEAAWAFRGCSARRSATTSRASSQIPTPSERATQQRTTDHDAAAKARPDGERDSEPFAMPGPEAGLSPGCDVGIVLQHYRQAVRYSITARTGTLRQARLGANRTVGRASSANAGAPRPTASTAWSWVSSPMQAAMTSSGLLRVLGGLSRLTRARIFVLVHHPAATLVPPGCGRAPRQAW